MTMALKLTDYIPNPKNWHSYVFTGVCLCVRLCIRKIMEKKLLARSSPNLVQG